MSRKRNEGSSRRRRHDHDEEKPEPQTPEDTPELADLLATSARESSKQAPLQRSEQGPFDESEATDVQPYIDLGGILVPPRDGLELKVEVEEESQRLVAVTLAWQNVMLQLQAFAESRSAGLWQEVRGSIREQLGSEADAFEELESDLGWEVRTRIKDSSGTTVPVRFLGADGPRWFLRGVVSGAAFDDEEAMGIADQMFREVVVRRGSQPMPPQDLIPLHIPGGADTPANEPA